MQARITASPSVIQEVVNVLGDIPQYIDNHSDVGGYYAPSVIVGDLDGLPQSYLRVDFPSSFLEIRDVGGKALVLVSGMRGSIQDMLLPILESVGEINPSSHEWEIESSSPARPWTHRVEDCQN